MKHENSLDVIVVDGAKNRANSYASTLERAGYTVNCDLAADCRKLEELLENSLPDLVLYGTGSKIPSLASVAATLMRHDHEIPLFVVDPGTRNLVPGVLKELKSARLYRRVSNLETEVENIRLQAQINELEISLKEQEIHSHALVENSRDAIAYIYDGKHVYGNHAYLENFGFEDNRELTGTPLRKMVDSSDHEMLAGLLSDNGYSEAITANIRFIYSGSHVIDSEVKFSPVRFDNRLCTRITLHAGVSEMQSGRELDVFDQRDIFTGLYNRQYFIQVLDENIQNNASLGLFQSITYVLLDNFRAIRENIGVIASDQMIGETAELIEEVYGHDSVVAQFGDYVFTILSESSNAESCRLTAETLRQRLAENNTAIAGHEVRTTASIGICVINEHVRDAEYALARADLACELARSSGGNQVHIHSTAIDDQIDTEVKHHWDEMIRKTVDENRFHLVYQPIASLNADKQARYEVLLRVVDEAGQVILPGQFISIAEKTGAIGDIDRLIISSALKTLSDNQKDENCLFIKISGHTLADAEFPAWVRQQLEQHHLQGNQIVFEITESTIVNNEDKTLDFVRAMHKIHCMVAIEHLGHAGLSECTKNLPVDFFKIDGSLINSLQSSKKARVAVKNILKYTRKAGIPCIAERVDEASCLVILWQIDMDYIQGNFVQEPGKQLDYDFEDEIASHGLAETV